MKVWTCSAAVALGLLSVAVGPGIGRGEAQIAARPAPAGQRPIPPLQAPISGFEYPVHETLTFTVDWRVFTAGIAVFHLDQAGEVEKLSATADSIGAINMLFPVVDRFQSGFDLKTGCSTGFNKQLQEGRRKIASELMFDYAHGRQTQNERNLVKGTATHREANIPACVTDSLAAIFYTQSQPLNVGQTVYFPLADSMRTVTVGMKVEAREEIKTPAGTFQTVKVQATADEGVVKNRGHIWIWYTDDPRHLPVQMQARLFWGTITFHLQSVDFK
ncbi:MAG TPA: DUF3108 domain-containing protein [Acidobacteriaceae bacterium]|nr:DUF3108 domain-containing protein [Acidobacteriaceae bacterium]